MSVAFRAPAQSSARDLGPGHLVERLGEGGRVLADLLVLVDGLGDVPGLDQEPRQREVGQLDDALLALVGGLAGGDLD